jgi:DNA polymerase III subunit beta
MYLRIFKEDIIEGVTKASNVVSQKTGAAYLRTLWLKAGNKSLEILSTDSNMEFTGKYNANVLEDGLVGVEGKKFSDLMRKLKPGEIVFKADHEKNILFIQQDKRKYKVPTTEQSWFPDLTPFPEDNSILWSGELIREIIDKISFSISSDDTMGSMTCMKIARGDETHAEVEFCGFDIENMGLYTIKNQDVYNLVPEEGILIPKKYISELRKWIPPKEVELCLSSDRFFIRAQDYSESISFPLSYAEFTNYRDILDSFSGELKSCLKVDRRELMEALDRILLFSTEFNKSALFQLKSDELIIESTAVEAGEANEVLECEYEGIVNELVFNIKSMLEIMDHFESREIKMYLSGQVRPCKIVGEDDPNYFVVTMPVEIQEETYYTEEEEE